MTNDNAPDDGRELLAAGAAAYQRGDVAEARRQFEEIADTSTGGLRVSALINAASMCDELGDHARAIVLFRTGLAEMPADAVEKRPAALINLSQALQHVGDLDGAQAALEQARAMLIEHNDESMQRVACLLSLTAVAFHRQDWAYAIELATETLDMAVRFAPQLAGHPLSTLGGIYFETGRRELAVDFMRQALAAFESAADHNAVAETEQNLAVMYVRLDRFDEAEQPLSSSQEYFERAELGHRAGVGLKTMGFLAESRDDIERADQLYRRSLAYFQESGAVLDAADVRVRLATVAYATGRFDEGELLIADAFTTYAERGLGLHCAQIDFWHATLLADVIEATEQPTAELLGKAVDLAVSSALAIDAVRYTLPNGNQREQWNREIADPAMRMAFRFAYLAGNGPLIMDLIETQCAGTTLAIAKSDASASPRLPLELLDPPALSAEAPVTMRPNTQPDSATQISPTTQADPATHLDSSYQLGPAAQADPTTQPDSPTQLGRATQIDPAIQRDSATQFDPATPTGPTTPAIDTTHPDSSYHHGAAAHTDPITPAAPAVATYPATPPDPAYQHNPAAQVDPAAQQRPALQFGTGAQTRGAPQLGTALAAVAAGAGLPVAPPPRLAIAPDGHIALSDYIAAAEQRYGHAVRDSRVLPA